MASTTVEITEEDIHRGDVDCGCEYSCPHCAAAIAVSRAVGFGVAVNDTAIWRNSDGEMTALTPDEMADFELAVVNLQPVEPIAFALELFEGATGDGK